MLNQGKIQLIGFTVLRLIHYNNLVGSIAVTVKQVLISITKYRGNFHGTAAYYTVTSGGTLHSVCGHYRVGTLHGNRATAMGM